MVFSLIIMSCKNGRSPEEKKANKGVGPIEDIDIPDSLDQSMVRKGKDLFKESCAECHEIEGGSKGPQMKGVMDKRSPEWVMNIILNPDEMISEDPDAKRLFRRFDSKMPDVGFSKDETRAVLEYMRSL